MSEEDASDQFGAESLSQETRRERFVRVAERRTRNVIERLRILGNCANRGVYEYGATDVDKIFRALERELEQVRHKFDDRIKRRSEFKLEP